MKPGQPARHDYEYKRNGTANLFMLFAPLEGWRHVEVTERRTAIDYAKILRDLADIHFPKAERIVLVQDNLNTHTPASLYEAFEPADLPPDRLRALRAAFLSTMRDTEFLGEAHSLKIEIAPVDGASLERIVREVIATPPQVKARGKQMLQ